MVFYSLAIASLIESDVPRYVRSLREIYAADPELCAWLTERWQPEEARHGALTRYYVCRTWPEFDWDAANAAFRAVYDPLCEAPRLRPTPGLEALARCVTEAQAAMGYRALAAYVPDPALAELLRAMSRDEVAHFSRFRRAFERHDRVERQGWLRKAAVVLARGGLVRDEDLALGFGVLDAHWRASPPFAPLTYPQFLRASARMLRQHLDGGAAARMLLKPLTDGSAWGRLAAPAIAFVARRQFSIQ